MKTLSLMMLAASLSSTATFLYATKKMDPELYQLLKTGTQMAVQQLSMKNTMASTDCMTDGSGRSPASIPEGKQPNMKELLEQAKKAQKEREEFFKEMNSQ